MFDHGNIVSGEAPTLISHSGGGGAGCREAT